MSHSTTLIGTITEKAEATWGDKPIPIDNYDKWKKHWLDTAKQWRDELQAEGLTETVKQLDKTIKFFEQGNGE